MPLVLAIFEVLSRPAEENDQTAALEKQMLRRSYFSFIQTIASSGMNEVLANQGESLNTTTSSANTHVCECDSENKLAGSNELFVFLQVLKI